MQQADGRRKGVRHRFFCILHRNLRSYQKGVQYAATAYTDLLAGRGAANSMASVGTPEENGYGEGLMWTIREKEIDTPTIIGMARSRSRHR